MSCGVLEADELSCHSRAPYTNSTTPPMIAAMMARLMRNPKRGPAGLVADEDDVCMLAGSGTAPSRVAAGGAAAGTGGGAIAISPVSSAAPNPDAAIAS